jgi:aspartate carbamoyltransferase regulatory subunit
MKKKNLKSLNLNKKSISILQQAKVSGGTIGTLCALISNVIECPSATCITTANSGEVMKPSCGSCDQ